jgi:alpha-L-fucosidase 2
MNAPKNQILWYKNPALRLMETLPVGNGRVGALIYGGAAEETLILCESTCLSGEASDKNIQRNPSQLIPQISEALFKQNYEQAHELAEGIKGLKNNYGTNLPFGRVKLAFDHGELDSGSYRRELCLNSGIAAIEYEVDHISYKREIFVSNPADLIVLRISTSDPHQLSFTFSLDGGENPFHTHTDAGHDLLLAGNAYETLHSDGKTGVAYHARVRILQQGGE